MKDRGQAEEFDYVIAGAGSAGCVLAARLVETPGVTVCLIEAGPMDGDLYIKIPAGFVKTTTNEKLTWGFTSDLVPSLGRKIGLPQGRAVGGSSSINGMVYNRGKPADYDGWAQRGNRGWSYEDILPYFRRSENWTGGDDPAYRGHDGPLTVSRPAFDHPLCRAFVKAAAETGIPATDDYNGARQEGAGTFQYTIDRSGFRPTRMSAARAFLHPAMKSGRIRLRAGSYAQRILFDARRATGVRYASGGPHGEHATVRARREVIVSSGALNTPRLLQISGIGDPDHLSSLGVDVVNPLKGVGRNLTDHYQTRISVQTRGVRTINERGRGLPLAWEIAKWLAGHESILGIGPMPMLAFARSDPALDMSDLQLSFTPASYMEGAVGLLDGYPGMTCGGYQQRPDSRGWVRAVSTDLAIQPEIQPNYLATERDRQAIIAVFRKAREIVRAPAFSSFYVQENFPGAKIERDDEILDFVRQYGATTFHHVGTARMGPSHDADAVVDDCLRVHGMSGLRVVDASIMPSITSGNTNAPTIMIAEKASDIIRQDHAG